MFCDDGVHEEENRCAAHDSVQDQSIIMKCIFNNFLFCFRSAVKRRKLVHGLFIVLQ